MELVTFELGGRRIYRLPQLSVDPSAIPKYIWYEWETIMNKIRFNIVVGLMALLFAALVVRVFVIMTDSTQPAEPIRIELGSLNLPPSPPLPKDLFVDPFIESELHCLALTVYGEARGETAEGMKAVAFVILNRVANRRYPNTVCEVALQPHQFEALAPSSPLHDMAQMALKGEMTFPDMNNKWIRNKIHEIAHEVYHGRTEDITKGAMHFYAPRVQIALGRDHPSWIEQKTLTRRIGGHNFYASCCAD